MFDDNDKLYKITNNTSAEIKCFTVDQSSLNCQLFWFRNTGIQKALACYYRDGMTGR